MVTSGSGRRLSFWEAGRHSGGSCSGAGRSYDLDSCGDTQSAIVQLNSWVGGGLPCSLIGALASAFTSDPVVVQEEQSRTTVAGLLAAFHAACSVGCSFSA